MELKEHIRQLEEKLLTAEVRASRTELKKILADEFFEFGSSGRVLYKNDEMESGIGIIKAKLSDFDIHPLSDNIVLATYRTFNERTNQHALRSSIWKQVEGDWKMVFHQGTKTGPSI
ncbi:nuclear transport factor 2 family protein [Mesobacillus jeotgali]|uniref:nuclear transport factor 2 family protein n=1 Tax=Mesobacillus jeotgali TaxID=129985 RepID=UPI0009A5D066|nr:DUF4440 domain-containing protein [Mesobacillus jeotgali]